MQKVLESKYLTATYTKHLKLLNVDYQEITQDMTTEEWQALMLSILEKIGTFDPLFLLSDNRNMKFVISVDLQIWFAKEIFEFVKEKPIQLQKFAIVLPLDFIAELALQQTVDESKALQSKTPYKQRVFTELLEAEKWLFNN